MNKGVVRVVFVLPSLLRAGAEIQLVNLVNNLDPATFEKHLFVFERQLDQLDRVDRTELQFHHYPRRHKFDIGPAVQLARLIDARHIDIVHCSLQIALFVGWLAVRLAKHKPRLVLALHTTVNRNLRDELFDRLFYQWLMRSCDRIICVCKAQEVYWQAKYPFLHRRTTVIYNGVDTEWFNPGMAAALGPQLKEQYDIPENAFVACCIAAFRPEKGHRHLLQAFKQVADSHSNAYLLLAGDGPLRVRMELLAKNLGLAKKVFFLGVLTDVRPVLAASDISIIASRAVETFSMAMLESLAMEVPMVATDIGGASEAIQDGRTGLLVPPADANALASALEHLITDHSVRRQMGQSGRVLIKERFTQRGMRVATSEVLKAV